VDDRGICRRGIGSHHPRRRFVCDCPRPACRSRMGASDGNYRCLGPAVGFPLDAGVVPQALAAGSGCPWHSLGGLRILGARLALRLIQGKSHPAAFGWIDFGCHETSYKSVLSQCSLAHLPVFPFLSPKPLLVPRPQDQFALRFASPSPATARSVTLRFEEFLS
jgi:hypothetical protein